MNKVAVYTICKNESKFVTRWLNSMQEADCICVWDTGSTDTTVQDMKTWARTNNWHIVDRKHNEKFIPELVDDKKLFVIESEEVVPWRFDVARNKSLTLVPESVDICVCTDLDEFFHSGWRAALEIGWTPGTTDARYRYTWNFTEDGKEGLVFLRDHIHSRNGWKWEHPVHEVLQPIDRNMKQKTSLIKDMQLDHHADNNKSRGQYLELLEMSVKESPDDDRNTHYLGREYMFKGRWQDSINTLKHHLEMPSATWKDERATSMIYIANCYENLNQPDQSYQWLLKAVVEAPNRREPSIEMANLLYHQQQWYGVIYFVNCALAITEKPDSYLATEKAWNELPYDLLSIAYYKIGNISEAAKNANLALKYAPNNERIQANVKFFRTNFDTPDLSGATVQWGVKL